MNWALAKEGVTPTGAAHRNVPKSSLPAAKAAGKDGALLLTGASGSELPAGWAEMGGPDYEELYQQVTSHLSAAADVYVEDAALGSYAAMALPTRAITDDGATAAFIKDSLCPIQTDVTSFSPAVTVYAVPGFDSGAGPIAAVNVERGEVILAGGASGSTMAAAVGPVAESYNAQQGLAPLNGQCSVVGGETVVVCAAEGAAPTGVPGTAFAKPVVVGKDGIWSLFRPQAADGKAVPNVLKLPSAIVLVGDGGGPEVATLTPQQAAIYLLGLKISASVRLPACSLAPCSVPGLLPRRCASGGPDRVAGNRRRRRRRWRGWRRTPARLCCCARALRPRPRPSRPAERRQARRSARLSRTT